MFSELPLPHLPLARYRLHWQTVDGVRLPAFAGSAWRGAFGHALKRLVCVTREPVCEPCPLYTSCIYPYIFETPPDPGVGKLTRYTAAPHPFVLRPESGRAGLRYAGEALELELLLFGRSNRLLAYVLHALDQAGQRGLGAGQGRLRLMAVQQQSGEGDWRRIWMPGRSLEPLAPVLPLPPACPATVTVTLETPLRIKREEHYVTPESFRFAALFGNLLRRISLLTAFHTETPLETDFAGLTRAAQVLEPASARLYWKEWTRYSSRQGTPLQMGGLVGELVLTGAELAPFWPYLWLGQWTHAGKGTSMGLGQLRLGVESGTDDAAAGGKLAGCDKRD